MRTIWEHLENLLRTYNDEKSFKHALLVCSSENSEFFKFSEKENESKLNADLIRFIKYKFALIILTSNVKEHIENVMVEYNYYSKYEPELAKKNTSMLFKQTNKVINLISSLIKTYENKESFNNAELESYNKSLLPLNEELMPNFDFNVRLAEDIKSQLESWFEEKVPKAGDCLKSLDDLIKHLEYKTDYDEYNFLYAVKEKMMAANFTLYISYYTRFFEEDDMNVFYDNGLVIMRKFQKISLPENSVIIPIHKNSFFEVEKFLFKGGYIDHDYKWSKKKKHLVEVIVLLEKFSYFKKNSRNHHNKNFFSERYHVDITQQMKPSRHPEVTTSLKLDYPYIKEPIEMLD
ncbi:MAG: hypothetical protein HN381_08420 [Bacteroidetes bacterium]|jgi:hypothetical protein|nr:hypothetical protein [Bacteroidota bacterium]MBT3422439.1 hypothetical protein [Bacteroidota bacterium]